VRYDDPAQLREPVLDVTNIRDDKIDPRSHSSGNLAPASRMMRSSPYSTTIMLLPISPIPPSGMTRSRPSLTSGVAPRAPRPLFGCCGAEGAGPERVGRVRCPLCWPSRCGRRPGRLCGGAWPGVRSAAAASPSREPPPRRSWACSRRERPSCCSRSFPFPFPGPVRVRESVT
jgi:hypothetical protein